MNRRTMLQRSLAAMSSVPLLGGVATAKVASPRTRPAAALPIRLSLKWGMVGVEGGVQEKFKLLSELGYDGVELHSPGGFDATEVRTASESIGLPVHGVVNSIHWKTRLSDPDPKVRENAVGGLKTALHDVKAFGGSSVLLVPGRVTAKESHDQVWERSIQGIREALPLAAELGVHILIENVWNGFCYEHDGPADQSAQPLADYIDEIASPWVGVYFDLGNHRKYGVVENWVRTLGRRIVKLDVKDWGKESGWAKIGDGDVNWPAVCEALRDIGFTGWATAEVAGGGPDRLADILERMRKVFELG